MRIQVSRYCCTSSCTRGTSQYGPCTICPFQSTPLARRTSQYLELIPGLLKDFNPLLLRGEHLHVVHLLPAARQISIHSSCEENIGNHIQNDRQCSVTFNVKQTKSKLLAMQAVRLSCLSLFTLSDNLPALLTQLPVIKPLEL